MTPTWPRITFDTGSIQVAVPFPKAKPVIVGLVHAKNHRPEVMERIINTAVTAVVAFNNSHDPRGSPPRLTA